MRRGDPQPIYEAKLAGMRNRIRDARRVPSDRADALLADWQAEAAGRGLENRDPAYWSQAERWGRGAARAKLKPGKWLPEVP